MIRIILAGLYLILFLILTLPLLVIEWLIGKWNKPLKDRSSLRIVQWGFRCILWLSGVKVTILGKEHIPEEPVLYIGNHRSFFDILLIYTQCRNRTGFVAKKSMNKIPSLRVWMRYLYCLFLDRENMKEGLKTILTAIDYVKQGISICIFPEGTRNKGEEGTLLPFHEGSFKIATKTGCKIVPVSMNNTAEIFENHFPWVKKTHVVMEYGTPIDPKTFDQETVKHIGAYCQDVIQKTIEKNASLV